MRLPLTIIAVAINILVFTTLAVFLMTQIGENKTPMLSTFFFCTDGIRTYSKYHINLHSEVKYVFSISDVDYPVSHHRAG